MEECEHYWVIPNTPEKTCQGICRKCQARREFLNRMPGSEARESPVQQAIRMVTRDSYVPEPVGE